MVTEQNTPDSDTVALVQKDLI